MAELIDKFDRKIDYLRISITDRCNLRCIYCMPPEGVPTIGHDQILTYEEIIEIARMACRLGITKIRLSGGEPLVRRKVVSLIRELNRLEGLKDLSLTTNGVLLAEYLPALVDAGLRRVNVSLDTMRPDRFREITRFPLLDRVLTGLDSALAAGLDPVKINVVVIRGLNDDEVTDFARLALEAPFRVRFIEFMPVGSGPGWGPEKVVSSAEIRARIEEEFGRLLPVLGRTESGPAKGFRLARGRGELGFISPVSRHFCGTCNRVRLTADGGLRPCLFSDEEVDLRAILRNGQPKGHHGELTSLMHRTIRNKPERHTLGGHSFKICERGMSAIGG